MGQPKAETKATDFQSIPVIDISGLLHGNPVERRAVAMEMGGAAREVGFFQIVGHGIAEEKRNGLINAAREFFAMPVAEKMQYYIGLSNNHRGYVPQGEESPDPGKCDLKEAFDLAMELPEDDPDVGPDAPLLGSNPWPEVAGFRERVESYYDTIYHIGRALMQGFALSLDLSEDRFLRYVNKPPSQLRLIHYPYDPLVRDAQGIGAHTDYECFTLLLPTTEGLEVMNGKGEWITVPYIEGALVVNIGDMLEIWTNGTFIATSHRVRKVKEERYAFPLFFACDYHVVVEPLPEFVAQYGQSRYAPLKAGDHLFAQTIHTFRYLQERLARGEIVLPEGALDAGSLGQHGRYKDSSLTS